MRKKTSFILSALMILSLVAPFAVFAEGGAPMLGQAVELTGAGLPQEIRDFTGSSSGSSSWDYLGQKIAVGYFVEVYSHFDALAKTKVDKRNGVEELVYSSYKSDSKANYAIANLKFDQEYAQQVMKTEFAQRSGRGTQIANTYLVNTYLPHSDGSVDYFKDGLLERVEDQRTIDEYGNTSFKDLYNFVYDKDRRLMLSHEYDKTDSLGNKTHGKYECAYTADSVFYGGDTATANKNYTYYKVFETDHTGRTTDIEWTAGGYEGKYLRDFSQKIEDSIYGMSSMTRKNIKYSAPGQMLSYDEEGLANHTPDDDADLSKKGVKFNYKLNRANISYNKGQIASYDETRWDWIQDDKKNEAWTSDTSKWTKTTAHAEMSYIETGSPFGPDVEPNLMRLSKTNVKSRIDNPDGSYKDETSVTTYTYDQNNKVTGAQGKSEYSGVMMDWYDYTDDAGHKLSKTIKWGSDNNPVTDENGNTMYEYSYIDSEGKKVVVEESKVTATKTEKGSQYKGASEITYEVVSGTPMAKEMHSRTMTYGADDATIISTTESTIKYTNGIVNNMARLLSSSEESTTIQTAQDKDGACPTKKTVTTSYEYNDKGYLAKVTGTGTGEGYEYSSEKGFHGHYTSTLKIDYKIKLDKPLEEKVEEKRAYDQAEVPLATPATPDFSSYTSSEALLKKTWEYYNAADYMNAKAFAEETVKRYAEEAAKQQADLTDFAASGKEPDYWALNDVATAHFILGKIYAKENTGNKAKENFNAVIEKYKYAQCWDTKGWFWKVADSAKEELDKL